MLVQMAMDCSAHKKLWYHSHVIRCISLPKMTAVCMPHDNSPTSGCGSQ